MRKIDPENFTLATRGTAREVNLRILLNLVRERQPVSRADLARAMGVARGTVTALINELIEEGLVREGGTADTRRGRKPTLLHIHGHDRLAFGVDVHRRHTHILLADLSGDALVRDRFRTPPSPGLLIDEIVGRVRDLAAAHVDTGVCQGLGLVVPGVVEGGTGRLLNAPTLGWTDVDFRTPLQEAFDFPVHVERDAVACALARIWLADADDEDPRSFVYVTVSEGVGTGLVVDGRVIRGSQFAAGEFGHVPLGMDGPLCSCGARGCWEAYASDAATVARYVERVEASGREGELADDLSVGDVVDRADAGEDDAVAALRETAEYLGLGIAAVINALNPGLIIVGGEISGAWPLLQPIIRDVIRQRTLTRAAAETPVRPEKADTEERLRGATALVLAPLFAAPELA